MNSLSLRQKQIIDFGNSAEFKQLNAYYSRPSIFGALGVSRHENTHSNFIAWLLTPKPDKNNHGLDDLPLRKFLEAIALACTLKHSAGKITPDLSNAILTNDYELRGIKVEREKPLKTGRIDIYIEGYITYDGTEKPLIIVIENKIKSREHDSQTKRYYDELQPTVSSRDTFLCIYLTPLAACEYERMDATTCESEQFIELNYQYLADYVIEPCRDSAREEIIKRYLDEYLLTLGQPEIRSNKGEILMALNKEERELLSRFWNKHNDLLTAVILSIGDYVPLEEHEEKIIQKAAEALKNASQRDLTRFSWAHSGGGGRPLKAAISTRGNRVLRPY